MTIFIFTIDFSTSFSKASIRAIAANIAGIAAFASFATCLFAFDALFYVAAATFVAFSAVALTSEFASAFAEASTWCCNSVARVLRCQRRSRGFNSPQHRHGIGRPAARTLVCETKNMGSIPIPSPISGRSSTVERLPWKQEAGRAARPAQTNLFRRGALPAPSLEETLGSVGEKQSHLPVKQSPQGFAGASPAAPTKCPGSPIGRDACLRNKRLVVRVHRRAHIPRSSNGRTRRFERWNGGSNPSLGDYLTCITGQRHWAPANG